MNPQTFPECNTKFGPPTDLVVSQCMTIPAFAGQISGGSLDSAPIVVVCWKPTERELELLIKGEPIYLSFIGGLPPHYPSMSFKEAINQS